MQSNIQHSTAHIHMAPADRAWASTSPNLLCSIRNLLPHLNLRQHPHTYPPIGRVRSHVRQTPFEELQQKLAEKKRARKLAKKMRKLGQASTGDEDEEDAEYAEGVVDDESDEYGAGSSQSKGKGKVKRKEKRDKKREKGNPASVDSQLQLLVADADERDYDMRDILQEEKLKERSSKRFAAPPFQTDCIFEFISLNLNSQLKYISSALRTLSFNCTIGASAS